MYKAIDVNCADYQQFNIITFDLEHVNDISNEYDDLKSESKHLEIFIDFIVLFMYFYLI